MTRRLVLSGLAALLFVTSGCGLFSRKKEKTKEDNAIASDVEESLKRRWVDKRVAELTAQGVAAEAARTQATQEFREKFEYTSAAKK
jgi:hypothetical protein